MPQQCFLDSFGQTSLPVVLPVPVCVNHVKPLPQTLCSGWLKHVPGAVPDLAAPADGPTLMRYVRSDAGGPHSSGPCQHRGGERHMKCVGAPSCWAPAPESYGLSVEPDVN